MIYIISTIDYLSIQLIKAVHVWDDKKVLFQKLKKHVITGLNETAIVFELHLNILHILHNFQQFLCFKFIVQILWYYFDYGAYYYILI